MTKGLRPTGLTCRFLLTYTELGPQVCLYILLYWATMPDACSVMNVCRCDVMQGQDFSTAFSTVNTGGAL